MEKDKKIKYLHLFHYTLFVNPYVKFINNNFRKEEHLFLVLANLGEINHAINVKRITRSIKDLLFLVQKMHESEKIFLHGLIHKELVILLFFQPWLIRKCYWVILGEDLYFYKTKKGFWLKIYEFMRSFVIKNFRGIIALFNGEYDLACNWYGVGGKFYSSFLYPNAIYKNFLDKNISEEKKTIIQVSHFADPRGKHLEVFNKLKILKDKQIKVFCPLVYGDDNYRKEVIDYGNKIFGDSFSYQLDILSIDDYVKLLNKVNIAIFAHEGNLAGTNMVYLLGLGKKVYLRNDTAARYFFKSIGLKIYDIDDDFNNLIEPISKDDSLRNIEIIKNYFTKENLIKQWSEIFNS